MVGIGNNIKKYRIMITKEQVKEILTKNPAGITKEELKFVFGIFCLSIKEYEK